MNAGYSFWCRHCKVSHAGECPTVAAPVDDENPFAIGRRLQRQILVPGARMWAPDGEGNTYLIDSYDKDRQWVVLYEVETNLRWGRKDVYLSNRGEAISRGHRIRYVPKTYGLDTHPANPAGIP